VVSQAKAAEIAGVSRAEFLDALHRFGVTPFQIDVDELIQEAVIDLVTR
jgi:predicted HTH domain antitoxin